MRRERAIGGNQPPKLRTSISEQPWTRKVWLAFWASGKGKRALWTSYGRCQKEKRKWRNTLYGTGMKFPFCRVSPLPSGRAGNCCEPPREACACVHGAVAAASRVAFGRCAAYIQRVKETRKPSCETAPFPAYAAGAWPPTCSSFTAGALQEAGVLRHCDFYWEGRAHRPPPSSRSRLGRVRPRKGQSRCAWLWLLLVGGLTACGPSLLERRMAINNAVPDNCTQADALVEEYAHAGAVPSDVRSVRAHVNALCASEAYTQGNVEQAETRAKHALEDEPGNTLAQEILDRVAARRNASSPPPVH